MTIETATLVPVYEDATVRLFHGDSREILAALPDNSIDSVTTDPPYGLSKEPDAAEVLTHWLAGDDYVHTGAGFMGNTWDSFVPGPAVWREVLRVLKPGGYAVVFSSSRTIDLTVIALRLAGFEVRDTLVWNFSQAFPKNYDIGKNLATSAGKTDGEATAAARDLAERYAGWGTTLKPSHELIALVRKPLAGTVLDTVRAHGTGGLNIDASRIRVTDASYAANCSGDRGHADNRTRDMDFKMTAGSANTLGRFPANFLLTHSEFCVPTGHARVKAPVINRFTDGAKPFGGGAGHAYESVQTGDADGMEAIETFDCAEGCPVRALDEQSAPLTAGDGGASRYYTAFHYAKKANKHERAVVWTPAPTCVTTGCSPDPHDPATSPTDASSPTPRTCDTCDTDWVEYKHDTVKPQPIIEWLIRLVTPTGGTTLDLYAGTGTTGPAARATGFRSVLIERDPVHIGMICKRLTEDATPGKGKDRKRLAAVPTATQHTPAQAGDLDDEMPTLFAV